MTRVYLANCLGFSPLLAPVIDQVQRRLEAAGCQVFEPFAGCAAEGEAIAATMSTEKDPGRLVSRLRAINASIASTNERAIEVSDVIVAVLDGSLDVDAGVAAEIGFARGRGKTIFALRTDFRLAADNAGSTINLQVEHFINESGGCIAGSVDALLAAMNSALGA